MLVLSRRVDQCIMIGDTIKIMITDIRGESVRIGIEAPPDISVHRKEVYDAVRKNKKDSASASTGQ